MSVILCDRAAAYVPGGEAEWSLLRASLPSGEVMQVLLDQLSAPGPDTFTGLVRARAREHSLGYHTDIETPA